eukprot:c20726_g3_i2.p1 GENE.c20726_g3_i2~~c20726_g3_i2.p1  ORF type:complete len:573 (-),score=139.06 c20726_g3_i2:177-1895(-)
MLLTPINAALLASATLCFFGTMVALIYTACEIDYSKLVDKLRAINFSDFLSTSSGTCQDCSPASSRRSGDRKNSSAMAVFGVPKTPFVDADGALCFDFVILGGGTAAMFAARKFAEDKKDRYTVALLSRENHTPFCPKKLVQALADRTAPESALMQDEQWFRENDQTLMLNTNVTQVDMKTRLLVGERRDPGSGKSTPVRVRASRALILATGARPIPGPQLLQVDRPDAPINWEAVDGYFMLRTYEVGLKLDACLDRSKSIIIVGGGFLGLDIAYIARNRGLDVTLVCSSKYVLRRVFTPQMSQMYQDFFASHGVKLVMGNQCTHILSEKGRVVGVRLKDGAQLACEMCVVACGVAPNIELARGQLQLEKGTSTPAILVDSFLVTSVPGVYAIGDVCAMRYAQHNPGAIRHCSNARLGGMHVVETLLDAMQTNKHRASRVTHMLPAAHTKTEANQQEQILQILKPGTGARPFVPHPAYDVNHFHFKGYVSGDRLGPDFVMVGSDMGPSSKMATFWLWENRVVGAYVSNPTQEEKDLLDEATRDQWYILNMPELRAMTNADEALEHIRTQHRL